MTKTVVVSFQKHPSGDSDWGFTVNGISTNDISVNAAEVITWELDNVISIPGTSLQGVVFTPSWTHNSINVQPQLNPSNQFQVNDNGPFDTVRTFHYTVSVQTPGQHVHSIDPDVTNTPPPP